MIIEQANDCEKAINFINEDQKALHQIDYGLADISTVFKTIHFSFDINL